MDFTKNLYTIVKSSPLEKEIKLTDEEHLIFKAHFPGNPILPGFLQIEIAQELFNLKIKKIKKLKFLTLVKPSTILTYTKHHNKISVKDENNNKVNELTYE
ncbi:MAG: 3-hydroxyacyl-ACP dehydratase [Candidatus Marinarcus sp.]|uniref:3-hydroxyacyl-ACP dehydratase n=1 Tax=Candidatus Marinarcus sp. TaxID=3100987 RepID=UPI003B000FF8